MNRFGAQNDAKYCMGLLHQDFFFLKIGIYSSNGKRLFIRLRDLRSHFLLLNREKDHLELGKL